MYDEMIQNY